MIDFKDYTHVSVTLVLCARSHEHCCHHISRNVGTVSSGSNSDCTDNKPKGSGRWGIPSFSDPVERSSKREQLRSVVQNGKSGSSATANGHPQQPSNADTSSSSPIDMEITRSAGGSSSSSLTSFWEAIAQEVDRNVEMEQSKRYVWRWCFVFTHRHTGYQCECQLSTFVFSIIYLLMLDMCTDPMSNSKNRAGVSLRKMGSNGKAPRGRGSGHRRPLRVRVPGRGVSGR